MTALPPYRLQALFDMREKAKKSAEDTYAQEKKKENDEKKKLETMEQTLTNMRQAREQKRAEYFSIMSGGGISIEEIQGQNRRLDFMRQEEEGYAVQVENQRGVLDDAKKSSEEALKKVTQATQEFKVLEKHKEKWLEQVKKGIAKKEESEMEDISQAQYFSHMNENKSDKE